jgi:hypothetical protein
VGVFFAASYPRVDMALRAILATHALIEMNNHFRANLGRSAKLCSSAREHV